jgi:hypothetical protein
VWACAGDDASSGGVDLLDGGTQPSIDAALGADATQGSVEAGADAASDAGGPSSSCRVRSDGVAVVAERAFDPQGRVAVAARSRGALLSWSQYRAGKSRVFSRWFGVTADAVDTPPDGDSNQLDVHSTATSQGFLTTWSDDLGGPLGLRARRHDDRGVPLDAAPIALTGDGVSHGAAVSAQGADGKLLVVYLDAMTRHGSSLLLGADARPAGAPRELFGATVGRPALAVFGTGYVVAWVDAATRRVSLQRLDAAGLPAGASMRVDSDGDAQGNLELTTSASEGALAWDVLVSGSRAEVRMRTFGADGAPKGIEQNLTPFPDSGLHPALVAARGGYIVAYRSARSGALALRLLLLDGRGKPVSASQSAGPIASLLQQDLPLAMRMTTDGANLFVGWLDQTPDTSEYALQRVWIGCD